jgi:hypothetical protein
MEQLGNVNVSGLSLSQAMRNDLAGGLSVAAFNSKYAGNGFQPISTSRQLAAPAPAAPAPAAPAANVSQPLFDFAAQKKAESDALIAKQNAQQESLFSNYENIRKGQEALPALYNRLQTEAGIPGLAQASQSIKDEIYKTKNTLDRLAEDVTARTTGTLTTDAQRRRLTTAESEPLQTNLGRLGTGLAPIADMLTSANQSVATQLGLQTQQQDRELEPVKMRINAISDRFAREITGFTSSKETELSAVLDKLTRDRQLSDRDWELAQTLAAEERAFARQKSLAASQLTNYNTGNNTNTTETPKNPYTYNDWASGGVVSSADQPLKVTGNTLQPTAGGLQGATGINTGMVGNLQGAGFQNYNFLAPVSTPTMSVNNTPYTGRVTVR